MLNLKEIRFDKWCKRCEYEKDSEFDVKSPCYECLYHMYNNDSTKPIEFKEKNNDR